MASLIPDPESLERRRPPVEQQGPSSSGKILTNRQELLRSFSSYAKTARCVVRSSRRRATPTLAGFRCSVRPGPMAPGRARPASFAATPAGQAIHSGEPGNSVTSVLRKRLGSIGDRSRPDRNPNRASRSRPRSSHISEGGQWLRRGSRYRASVTKVSLLLMNWAISLACWRIVPSASSNPTTTDRVNMSSLSPLRGRHDDPQG